MLNRRRRVTTGRLVPVCPGFTCSGHRRWRSPTARRPTACRPRAAARRGHQYPRGRRRQHRRVRRWQAHRHRPHRRRRADAATPTAASRPRACCGAWSKAGLRLEDDPDQTLDDRGRRMYRAKLDDGASSTRRWSRRAWRRPRARALATSRARRQPRPTRATRSAAAPGAALPAAPRQEAAPGGRERSRQWRRSSCSAASDLDSLSQPVRRVCRATGRGHLPGGFAQDVVAGRLRPADELRVRARRPHLRRAAERHRQGLQERRAASDPADRPLRIASTTTGTTACWAWRSTRTSPRTATCTCCTPYENDASRLRGQEDRPRRALHRDRRHRHPDTQQIVCSGTQFDANGLRDHCSTADCIPSEYLSHSVGTLKFADDGSLFLTTGDAASFNEVDDRALRAQNLDSLGGKVLRINTSSARACPTIRSRPAMPTPTAPRSGRTGCAIAYRFNLKPGTRIPYLGDVGWNNGGGQRGAQRAPTWAGRATKATPSSPATPRSRCARRCTPRAPSAVHAPIFDWSHNFLGTCCGAAATGGVFLQGTAYPAQYQGAYFYADFAKEFIRYLRTDANDVLVPGSETRVRDRHRRACRHRAWPGPEPVLPGDQHRPAAPHPLHRRRQPPAAGAG